MGTYPSFAFTPDDSAVIIWAAGKIWHIPLKTNRFDERILDDDEGGPKVIPFKAKISKRLADTRTLNSDKERDKKAKQALYDLETGDTQPISAFTELDIDEEGRRVVLRAAGKSYVQDIDGSDGKIVPVLKTDLVYYTPSFVPGTNGTVVIHSRWSDSYFSAFEIADVENGKAYELKKGLPLGRYRAPTICSCQGQKRKIAFVKAGGDILTGDIVATAYPGLYIGEISLPEGDDYEGEIKNLKYIELKGVQVESGDNVLKMRFLKGAEELLIEQSAVSFIVELGKGVDEFGRYGTTTVLKGKMAREVTVSPASIVQDDNEEKFAAFLDFYDIYIVKNASFGGDEGVWSKPGKAPKGLARVSLDGGHDIRWSKNGRVVWMLGIY